MKLALHDSPHKFILRCPDCSGVAFRMTMTQPWRLYCSKCGQELQNPDHPEYYPTQNDKEENPE